MEYFGKKLAELRKQKGISQDDLATDLNVSQSSISNYEAGNTTPDTETLKKIADYFQVPVSYLFSDDKFIFNTEKNEGGNSGYMVNSTFYAVSEKLITMLELRLAEKDELIAYLKAELEKYKE
ncbi:MAG: helix-turn-helix transcriptional regulator [Prevotellaceae bacterium]|jgi:transcriptional regulator with XRE-family HTH domain|nr:helix-turn-helix transcriptional regulator [Prevotellaceae bacterium]